MILNHMYSYINANYLNFIFPSPQGYSCLVNLGQRKINVKLDINHFDLYSYKVHVYKLKSLVHFSCFCCQQPWNTDINTRKLQWNKTFIPKVLETVKKPSPDVNQDVHQGHQHQLCGLLYHEHFQGMDTGTKQRKNKIKS